jgi:rhodanese-related sulfurtransferase
MSDTNIIAETAHQRAQNMGLPYSGALTPQEAYQLWQHLPGAKLVDVRTRAEWDWVGRIPDAIEIELQTYPASNLNPQFISALQQQVDKTAPVLFICRSGGRSHNAALMAMDAGFQNCYNVMEGFEGDRDAQGHRNTSNGWRQAGLPWVQG